MSEPSPLRIGHGYDIHRLQPSADGDLVLANVRIPCGLTAVAHSDGDVVLHALCDALLGAVGAGDIGEHFPDTDPANADRDSATFLLAVLDHPALADYHIVNCDITVIAQHPRLDTHKDAMRVRLRELLGLPPDRLGLKARSKEGVDATGRGEAIEAHVVVLLFSSGG